MVKRTKSTSNVLTGKVIEASGRFLSMRPGIRHYAVPSYIALQNGDLPNFAWIEVNKDSFRICLSKFDENGQKQYDDHRNEIIYQVQVTENDNISGLAIFEIAEKMLRLQESGCGQK